MSSLSVIFRLDRKNNIHIFYLSKILGGCFFFIPIIVLFWQSNGLTFLQIMTLQSFFAYIIVILEIPSGYLADTVGRKQTMIIGQGFLVIAVTIYSVSSTFWQFMMAELFLGVSMALISGADKALLFDYLKNKGIEDQFQRILGNAVFLLMLSLGVSSIVGGYMAVFSLRWPLAAMIPFTVLNLGAVMLFEEPPREKKKPTRGYALELMRVIGYTLKTRELQWLITFYAILHCLNQIHFWFYQPYMKLVGIPLHYFGYIFASFQIAAAVFSKYAYKIEAVIGKKNLFLGMPILVASGYFLMTMFPFWWGIAFIYLGQFVRAFLTVVVSDYINRSCGSEYRATVLSIQNMAGRLTYAALIPAIGFLADTKGVLYSFNTMGLIALIIGLSAIAGYHIFLKSRLSRSPDPSLGS